MKPCPKCGCPDSFSHGHDGDFWRTCRYCQMSTAPHSTAGKANIDWNCRDDYPISEKGKKCL